jgi:hypothetical protein
MLCSEVARALQSQGGERNQRPMTKYSQVQLVFLVAALGSTVGCDSSTPLAAPPADAVCARLTACGLLTSLTDSFGGCQMLISAAESRGPSLSSTDKLSSVLFDCIARASTCDELRACNGPTPAQTAICDSTDQTTCDGNVLILCNLKDSAAGIQVRDCAKAGQICSAGSYGGASCGNAACDPANTPPTCDGDLLVTCDAGGNVLVSEDCRRHGQACRPDSSGQAVCLSDTPCTSAYRCDGTAEVWCEGDTEARDDCTMLGPNWTCSFTTQDTSGGSSSTLTCVQIPGDCKIGVGETCRGGVITYCKDGRSATYDCHAAGFSGCTAQSIGARSSAGCVL